MRDVQVNNMENIFLKYLFFMLHTDTPPKDLSFEFQKCFSAPV